MWLAARATTRGGLGLCSLPRWGAVGASRERRQVRCSGLSVGRWLRSRSQRWLYRDRIDGFSRTFHLQDGLAVWAPSFLAGKFVSDSQCFMTVFTLELDCHRSALFLLKIKSFARISLADFKSSIQPITISGRKDAWTESCPAVIWLRSQPHTTVIGNQT